MPLKICYHGTSEENARSILREGFRKGTYFFRHLESAIEFGGPHVFGVAFDDVELPDNWQFTLRDAITNFAGRIVHYRVYKVRTVAVDKRLEEEVLQSNLAMGPDYCDREK